MFKIDFQDGGLDFQSERFKLFLIYTSRQYFLPSKFLVNWPFGSAEEIQNRFQDGGHGHLGVWIRMVSAIFLSTNYPNIS